MAVHQYRGIAMNAYPGTLPVSGRDLLTRAPRLSLRRAVFRTETALRSVISSFCLAGVGHAWVSGARPRQRRNRWAQATGPPALTPSNCLVQSRTDTLGRKAAVQSQGVSQ